MCVTAVIAGASLLFSAVGTYAQIQTNKAQNDWNQYNAREQTKELKARTELAKISSLETENARGREFQRSFSASLAAIAGSGVAEHISFFQGVAPDNMNQFASEIRAIRLNLVSEVDRNFRQIGVIKYGAQVSQFNSQMANVGAIAGFMQDAMSAASFYANMKTPSGGASKAAASSALGMYGGFTPSLGVMGY